MIRSAGSESWGVVHDLPWEAKAVAYRIVYIIRSQNARRPWVIISRDWDAPTEFAAMVSKVVNSGFEDCSKDTVFGYIALKEQADASNQPVRVFATSDLSMFVEDRIIVDSIPHLSFIHI